MKIAMLLDNPFTNDRRVYREAKSLVDNGYDVTVICKNNSQMELPMDEIYDGIKIKRFFKANLGTSVIVHKYLEANMDLYNSLNEKFDVYHCHDTETWPIGYMLSQRDGAKFVCDSHEYFPDYICRDWYNDEFKYRFSKMLILVRGNYIRYADKVITVSEPISEKLAELYGLRENPTVIYNIIPMIEFNYDKQEIRKELEKKYNIPIIGKLLLYEGMIEHSRGVDIVIQALKYIEDAYFIVLGSDNVSGGKYVQKLKSLAQVNNVGKRVVFTGFIQPEQMYKYICSADIGIFLAMPWVKNLEYAMPNKFFDYVFSEIPVVLSDLHCFKKFIDKHKIGEIVDIHNINICKIAEAINKLLNDKEKQRLYSKEESKIKKIYSWKKQEQKLIDIYEDIKNN